MPRPDVEVASGDVSDAKYTLGRSGPVASQLVPADVVAMVTSMTQTFAREQARNVEMLAGIVLPAVEQLTTQLTAIAETFASLSLWQDFASLDLEVGFPPNVYDAMQDDIDWEELVRLQVDHGLAVAWVLPAATIRRLVVATSPAARRDIIRQNAVGITRACHAELAMVKRRELASFVGFATKALSAYEAGHRDAAQSLAANLLDTMLGFAFGAEKRDLTRQDQDVDPLELTMVAVMVIPGIWRAHRQYWPSRGEKIPREFSRHASAHGVSSRQYTHANALTALMHVVAFLRLLQADPSLTLQELEDAFPAVRTAAQKREAQKERP